MPAGHLPPDAGPKRRSPWPRIADDPDSRCSWLMKPPPKTADTLPNAPPRKPRQRDLCLMTLRIELACLAQGGGCRTQQPERLLALAEFEPKQKMPRLPFNSLLEQFERQHKLLVIVADPRCEPGDKPILGRQ